MYTSVYTDDAADAIEWRLLDSDLVCFVGPTRADRGGFHGLIHQPGDPDSVHPCDQSMWMHQGPCTVTLEAVSEPGEWQVPGLSVRRRLYSVSISHG